VKKPTACWIELIACIAFDGLAQAEEEEEKTTEEAEISPELRSARDYSLPSFFAGAMLGPLSMGLWAARPFLVRWVLQRAKKQNPLYSV
jgi:hypothetical protein